MIYLRIPFSCFFQVLYHSIKTGIRGTCPPTGVGAEPLLHPVSTRPTSAASGAAQPPRPQGAGFRRKREPRGAGGRRKPVQTLCVKTGVRGTEPPTGVRGRSPCFTQPSHDLRARAARSRGRRKLVQTLCVETGARGTCPPMGVGGGAPANGTCSPDRAAGTETLQCATSSIRAILLRSLSAHPNCPTDQS